MNNQINKPYYKKGLRLSDRRNCVGYLFVLPFILGIVLIFIPAIVNSLKYSFENIDIGFNTISHTFVGTKNFIDAFASDTQYRVFITDFVKGMLGDLVVILFFSFFVANILNQKFIGRGLARTIFFLPVLLATGFVASADNGNQLMSLYNSSSNTASTLAGAFTGGGLALVTDLHEALISLNMGDNITSWILSTIKNTSNVVNSSGVQILIFLSALQAIPPSVFESAKVEGATKWEEFWKITFPMLTPTILVNFVYTVIDSFSNPKYQILSYIQGLAFKGNRIGYASALSWIYFIIVAVIIGLIWIVLSKRIQYMD